MGRRSWIGLVLPVALGLSAVASAQTSSTPETPRRDPTTSWDAASPPDRPVNPFSTIFGGRVAREAPPPQQTTVPAEVPAARDTRVQYPRFLANSYVGVNIGSINYPFSSRQLEPGFEVESVDVPHAALRVTLFGHQFHKYLSGQIGYTRPGRFVMFRNVAGTGRDHSAWMAMGDVTLKSQVSLGAHVSLYGEGGLAIVSRRGFELDSVPVIRDAQFAAPLIGGGLEFHVNEAWDLLAGVAYVPAQPQHTQPEITFASSGFRYNMRTLSPERVAKKQEAGFIFPRNVVQVGFSANTFGYGLNNALEGKVFWGGLIEVARGGSFGSARNVFHTRRVFALDLGASLSIWQTSDHKERFATVSAYPVLRFTVVRTKPSDVYVMYSVAGPTFITRRFIEDRDTGNRFTFQDMVGVGTFVGARRHLLVEVGISHFSNGNMFARNPGAKIPLTFSLGYGF